MKSLWTTLAVAAVFAVWAAPARSQGRVHITSHTAVGAPPDRAVGLSTATAVGSSTGPAVNVSTAPAGRGRR